MRLDGTRGSILTLQALTLLAAPALAAPAFAAPPSPGEPPSETVTLVTVHHYLQDEASADPDRAMLRYGELGGRWQAMGGGGIVLVGGPLAGLRAAIALEGFIELVNFNDDQPVPWESFRANIGFNTFWEAPALARAILPPGGRLHLAVGWFHESDHAAALSSYVSKYLKPFGELVSFDNANFSAYEYVKLRLCWQQPLWGGRLTTQTALGARLFPPPINPGSIRGMRWSFLTEARASVRVTAAVHPFLAGYFELLQNDFDADRGGFRGGLDHEPLRYRTISAGVDLRAANGSIVTPEIVYSSSHGRGIDFPLFHGPELGFRLGFLL